MLGSPHYLSNLADTATTFVNDNFRRLFDAFNRQESWITPTLLNSWVGYNYSTHQPPGYMKDSLGFVHLRGLIKDGTIGAIIFTLPAGYRPTLYHNFSTSANNAFASVFIDSNGGVGADSGSNVWFSLAGITFKAEQ